MSFNINKKHISMFLASVCLILIITGCNQVPLDYSDYELKELCCDNEIECIGTLSYNKFKLIEIGDDVVSKNVIIYDMSNQKILSMKNAFDRAAPASLTKILTAIVAIENVESLDEKVTLSPMMFEYIKEQNASIAGFSEYEQLSVRDLLYGTMLPSGADAAIGLAEHIAGSEHAFTELMNAKAEELGCYNSHFANVTGLDDDNNYSTAYDMCLILNYAYNNPDFREIFSSEVYYVDSTNKHQYGLTLNSTVYSSLQSNQVSTDYLIGGKTGYTYAAGLCLATVNKKNGCTYTVVTMGAGDGSNRPAYHVLDYQLIFGKYI